MREREGGGGEMGGVRYDECVEMDLMLSMCCDTDGHSLRHRHAENAIVSINCEDQTLGGTDARTTPLRFVPTYERKNSHLIRIETHNKTRTCSTILKKE